MVYMICAVCKRVLNSRLVIATGEMIWEHPTGPDDSYDHEPAPAPSADLAGVHLVCDFCSQPNPMWSWSARRPLQVNAGGTLHDYSSTPWAACHTCSELIKARDLDGLVSRVSKTSPLMREVTRHERRRLKEKLRERYRQLLAAGLDGPRLI